MLTRCAEIKTQGRSHGARRGVLVKAPKPGQEERIDMPTIGPETVRRVLAAGLAGIAVAAGHTLLAERKVTLKLADAEKLFVFGQKWSGSNSA